MTPLSFAVVLVARICLVGMFPLSALEKILDWRAALGQAESSWVPGGPLLVVLAILIEGITPFCIVFGWHDRLAAFVLAGFCVVTALLYHRFWAFPDFWSDPHSQSREHFWQFVKNFGLVGGLLLVVFAGAIAPPEQVLARPLSSSYSSRPGGPS
jgi:putative oxidoreductase